jgi:hypothetical protein
MLVLYSVESETTEGFLIVIRSDMGISRNNFYGPCQEFYLGSNEHHREFHSG